MLPLCLFVFFCICTLISVYLLTTLFYDLRYNYNDISYYILIFLCVSLLVLCALASYSSFIELSI